MKPPPKSQTNMARLRLKLELELSSCSLRDFPLGIECKSMSWVLFYVALCMSQKQWESQQRKRKKQSESSETPNKIFGNVALRESRERAFEAEYKLKLAWNCEQGNCLLFFDS